MAGYAKPHTKIDYQALYVRYPVRTSDPRLGRVMPHALAERLTDRLRQQFPGGDIIAIATSCPDAFLKVKTLWPDLVLEDDIESIKELINKIADEMTSQMRSNLEAAQVATV